MLTTVSTDGSVHLAAMLVRQHERLRLSPYRDATGLPNIGYGHLLSLDSTIPLARWSTITLQQAEHLLYQDLVKARWSVDNLVTVPLSQPQEAALIDFVFNEGVIHLTRSTLLRDLNVGKYDAIPDHLKRWEYPNHRRLAERVRRRQSEAAMWRGEY